MSAASTPSKKTIFDEEITQLENRRANVESERQMLLAGQITVTGPDGSSQMKIDLGALSIAANDQKTVDRNLKQTLVENPLMPVLDNSFKKTRELREEMAGRGELPNGGRTKSPFVRLVRANQHFNQVVHGKEKRLGRLVSSPWWLFAGIVLILVWCAGPLLYALSGGTVGGKQVGTAVPIPTVTAVSSVSPKSQNITPTANAISAVLTSFIPKGYSSSIPRPLKVQLQTNLQDQTATPTPSPARVGDTPSSAGGLNGPHGAFLAPSRFKVAALSIDTPVERALTQSNTSSGAAVVTWPRPGEVVQTGAYPGEIGNMLVMGNQKDLGALRRVQQNDEVTVYDRKGNFFIYRFVAFSADGQAEREVDPTSLDDAWIFAPTQEAMLTILVTYPQPLPAVDPNNQGSGNQVTVKDDYLTQKKLAYRAVLAMYAPAQVTPAGTPVAVPESAWQTVAAPVSTSSPTPAPSTITPEVSPDLPAAVQGGNVTSSPGSTIPTGLPNTGGGGSASKVPAPVNPKQ